jgi:F-type H+-transporting ATPase subunit alpha
MEEQVVALHAGINGYLDDVPTDQISRFQDELREYMRTDKAILAEIRDTGDLSDVTVEKLNGAIEKFKETFSVRDEETVAA